MAETLERDNTKNTVWLPIDPLDYMLLTNAACGDLDTVTDNSHQPKTYSYCKNPFTGEYELYAAYTPKPEPSELALMIPVSLSSALENLARWRCPFPMQVRGYCASPAANQNAWTGLLHFRRTELNVGTLTNLTALGPERDAGTAMLSRNAQFDGPWIWGADTPPGVFAFPATRTAIAAAYADAPSCGVCDGIISDGCQTLFLLGDITASGLADLRYSTDGGVSTTTVTLSGAFALEVDPHDVMDFNGRLIVSIADTIYYNDTPTNGATWIEATTTTGAAITATGKLARNGRSGNYAYALFNVAGVMRSSDGSVWEEVTPGITASQQNSISADGDGVVTAGANDSVQISISAGARNTWSSLATGPGAGTDDATSVSVSVRDFTNPKGVVIWLSQVTATVTNIYKSNDLGSTWSLEKVVSSVQAALQLQSVVDGDWIYANYGATTIKNHNRGYGLDWLDVSNADAGAEETVFTVCPYNPNTAFVATNLP